MQTNNYYKVGRYTYFFDDRVPSAVWDTWRLATLHGPNVTVYRMPHILGPWRREAGLVGFRAEADIRSDIRTADSPDELRLRQDELYERQRAVGHVL